MRAAGESELTRAVHAYLVMATIPTKKEFATDVT